MSQNEKIKVSQLQAGDILLLTPCDDWISKLIVKLTKSPVSHTALSCGQADAVGTVIEETPPSAVKGTVLNRTERTAYVMRLQSDITSCQPVMNIAANYVSENLPYAYAQLPFIGLYCIVNDLAEGNIMQGLITRLMRIAMGIIAEIEDKIFYDGKEAMMCSQFAYHCYREAGKDYEIHMKDTNSFRLIDKIIEIVSKNPQNYNEQVFDEEMTDELASESEINEVLSGICNEIDGSQNDVLLCDSVLEEEFIVAVSQFCVKFVKAFSKEYDNEKKDVSYYLEILKDMKEYFIAPGDLLSNTTNLLCFGTVDYEGYQEN